MQTITITPNVKVIRCDACKGFIGDSHFNKLAKPLLIDEGTKFLKPKSPKCPHCNDTIELILVG